MRFTGTRTTSKWLVAATIVLGMASCASPPAVGPLLAVVDRAIAGEQQRLKVDLQRHIARVSGDRDVLTRAFDADLQTQQELTADWVRDHAMVYAVAREALAEHATALEAEAVQRQKNLADARRAQRAAIGLIEQQDQLFAAVPDARRWLADLAAEEESNE